MSDAARLEAIERRVAQLERRQAIVETLQRYATAIDYGLDEDWLDCFLPDGVFEVRPRLAPAFRVEGQAALRPFIALHTKAPSRWHKHLITQHRIEVDERSGDARVQSYILRVDEDDDAQPKLWVFGRYLDELRLCADGRWRFSLRVIEIEGAQPAAWAPLQQRLFDPSRY